MVTGMGWRIDGLVLDVDDTLYLERTYVESGFRAVGSWIADTLGIEGFSDAALKTFAAGARGDVFDQVLVRFGVEPTAGLVTELVDRYRAHRPVIQLLPDAAALIARASQLDLPIAVITDGPALSQRLKVESLGISGRCHPIVITSDTPGVRSKPDPSAFRLVERSWGVDPKRLLYIGDNPSKDFLAPRSLGWRTVRVRRSGGLHENAVSGPDVDHEVTDLNDCEWILDTNGATR
jgi:putative hydrolase of the HAD superfamily